VPVELDPTEFTLVRFDAARVHEIAEDVAARVGLGDIAIHITVEERSPLGFVRIESLDPLALHLEGGAIENPKRPRELSEAACRESVGRLLLEARDRLDPEFGAPPLDEDLPAGIRVAWDTYIVGRLVRAGGRDQQQRRRYAFRVRHGFDDRADASFDRLWSSDGLTFADLT